MQEANVTLDAPEVMMIDDSATRGNDRRLSDSATRRPFRAFRFQGKSSNSDILVHVDSDAPCIASVTCLTPTAPWRYGPPAAGCRMVCDALSVLKAWHHMYSLCGQSHCVPYEITVHCWSSISDFPGLTRVRLKSEPQV